MDLGIRGRTAIVNGGSAGLGRGAALALAQEGVEVFVSARGEERLIAACSKIADSSGARVTPIVADHSTDDGRETILAACPEPDILVATCAPPPFLDDYRDLVVPQWHEALNVALTSPVQFMQEVVPGMAERGWGRVVNIATAAAKYPAEMRILSGPPRAALVNYAVAISKMVASNNVTVNTLLPGMHDTEGIREEFGRMASASGRTREEFADTFMSTWPIPANRFGDPNDGGRIVAMFCSEFANYVTGQSLVVDGGATRSIF